MDYWYVVETIHFFLGFIGCVFFPNVVINSYSLFPTLPTNEKTYEFIHVLAMFYLSFTVMCYGAIYNLVMTTNASLILSVFYGGLMVQDIIDILKIGYKSNPLRYMDTLIHLVFGFMNMYIYSYYLYEAIGGMIVV